MEAVSPVLQSAIVDKFGKPFAERTQKIVENLDITVEKQETVVEKQDELGDKIKKVSRSLDTDFKGAFSKSADGIKELTFGFVDLKGIIEEVGKKFSAIQDVFAPIAEIGSFGFQIGQEQDTLEKISTGDKEEKEKKVLDRFGNPFDSGSKSKDDPKNKKGKKGEKQELGRMDKMNKASQRLTAAFGNLLRAMAPLMLKFLVFGGLFVALAFGVGKLIQALGGWNLIEDSINYLDLQFLKLGRSMAEFMNFIAIDKFSDEYKQREKEIAEKNKTIAFKEKRLEDRAKTRKLEAEFTDEDGVFDKEGFKTAARSQNLTTRFDTINEAGQRVDIETGEVIDKKRTSDLMREQAVDDYLNPGFFKTAFRAVMSAVMPGGVVQALGITDLQRDLARADEQREIEDQLLIESGIMPKDNTYTFKPEQFKDGNLVTPEDLKEYTESDEFVGPPLPPVEKSIFDQPIPPGMGLGTSGMISPFFNMSVDNTNIQAEQPSTSEILVR